jgi:lipopolysaccharide transport protein LptA
MVFNNNVEATRGELSIECETMEIYLDAETNDIERVFMKGDVRILQGSSIASADVGTLYSETETLELEGNCSIVQNQDQLHAKKIVFNQLDDIYTAEGDVIIQRTSSSRTSDAGEEEVGLFTFSSEDSTLTVFSDSAQHFKRTRITIYKGNVNAKQGDLVLKSDFLETLLDADEKEVQNLRASGNVRIKQDNNIATGIELLYNNLHKKLILTGNPAIVMQADRVDKGKRILLYTDQRKIYIDNPDSETGESVYFPDGQRRDSTGEDEAGSKQLDSKQKKKDTKSGTVK